MSSSWPELLRLVHPGLIYLFLQRFYQWAYEYRDGSDLQCTASVYYTEREASRVQVHSYSGVPERPTVWFFRRLCVYTSHRPVDQPLKGRCAISQHPQKQWLPPIGFVTDFCLDLNGKDRDKSTTFIAAISYSENTQIKRHVCKARHRGNLFPIWCVVLCCCQQPQIRPQRLHG